MPKFTLFYSVQNGGDGSAYPNFMESQELAEFDQAHMSEGWGESCTGSITLESTSPITVVGDDVVTTKEAYYIIHYCNKWNADTNVRAKFLAQFFPSGLPKFSVKTEEVKTGKDYLYNHVFLGERRVARVFLRAQDSGEVFEKFLEECALST